MHPAQAKAKILIKISRCFLLIQRYVFKKFVIKKHQRQNIIDNFYSKTLPNVIHP